MEYSFIEWLLVRIAFYWVSNKKGTLLETQGNAMRTKKKLNKRKTSNNFYEELEGMLVISSCFSMWME